MKGLFRKLGHGILFVFVLPIWVLVFALFTLWSIVVFFFTFFSAIPAFFRGESILEPSELDVAASTKLAEKKMLEQAPPVAPVVQPTTTIILNTLPPQPGQLPNQQVTYIQDGTVYRKLTNEETVQIPEGSIVNEEKND